YVRFDLPTTGGLELERTDFAPDGRRGALIGLKMTNPSRSARTVTVKVDAHSELLAEYPWSFDNTPHARDQLPDTAALEDGALRFREQGTLPHPNATPHDYAAYVASDRRPAAAEVNTAANGHRGPQGTNVCTAQEMPSACDDGPFGKGAGGQLRYRITVDGRDSETLWIAVMGSDKGPRDARSELRAALRHPDRQLREKIEARERWGDHTRLSLPGDRRLQAAVDWGKQNLLDLTRVSEDLQVRWLDQGNEYTAPLGTVDRARWVGAGYPDYPWMFATDAEYTAFASVTMGQFEQIKDHMVGLRDVSEILNEGSGIVTHEVISEGSNWFGKDQRNARNPELYDFNTDETVKYPSAVALIWRWTGDDRFRHELYDFTVRGMRAVVDRLDEDGDGWPEGSGNVERPGMGVEKLDNSVYLIRGLYDLADLARAEGDRATERWALDIARQQHQGFEDAWWYPGSPDGPQYADSIDDPPVGGDNNKQQDKHWIGVTPMEAELTIGGMVVPGLATYEHGNQALALRETECYSGSRPYNLGLFHTGCGGGPTGAGERTIFGLNTAIQAVGEGNYGRMEGQRRYTDAEAEPMFGQPYTGGTPDEQPGSLPEILPSPDFDTPSQTSDGSNDANIERCWSCRAMFVQAWGHYGTVWPVVHQQLGVRPDIGRDTLEVVPQLPSSAPIAGRDIRLGKGSIDVAASRDGKRYRTEVDTDVKLRKLLIGHTLPRGSQVRSVWLDGRRTRWEARTTNRGLEVTVQAGRGDHELVIEAR
ncbi:MAG TPA: hypothetical protein VFX80_13185, partial [Solirubrobacteraceae bacterium]|nr:hypothetical protein [Solirubrobacteraceae bacterium]